MKKIKEFILVVLKNWPIFILILATSISCYLIVPGMKTSNQFFVISLVCAVIFGLLSVGYLVLIYIKGKKQIECLFSVVCYILLSGVVLTIFFRITSSVNENFIINKTGFASLIALFCYYFVLICLSASLFKNSDKFIEHKI